MFNIDEEVHKFLTLNRSTDGKTIRTWINNLADKLYSEYDSLFSKMFNDIFLKNSNGTCTIRFNGRVYDSKLSQLTRFRKSPINNQAIKVISSLHPSLIPLFRERLKEFSNIFTISKHEFLDYIIRSNPRASDIIGLEIILFREEELMLYESIFEGKLKEEHTNFIEDCKHILVTTKFLL